MKMTRYTAAALLALALCVPGLLPSASADARTIRDIQQEPATVSTAKPSDTVPSDAVLEKYYLVKGSRYDRIVALLESLPAAATSLTAENRPYGIKVDKQKTGGYFYHAQAYHTGDRTIFGDFLIAKDDSCAWRTDTGGEAALIYGNTEKLLKECDVRLTADHIIKGDYGRARVALPAALPYDIRITSLNESVAVIDEEQRIIPVAYGKVDLLIELRIGGNIRTFERRAYIVDESYYRESGGGGGWGIPIGIGIGIGHHHHGHGHIGIGLP